MALKGQNRNGSVELTGTPAHLMRRCNQFYGDLFVRETGDRDLTKQQYLVLCALEQHEGVSQTALVSATGIDRSTMAEMIRRMLERGFLTCKRTEDDARANAVAISPSGRRILRSARLAAERAERALLEPLAPSDRSRFVKCLATIAQAAEQYASGGAARALRKPSGRRL